MSRLVLFMQTVTHVDAAFSHIPSGRRAYNHAVIHDLHMHSTASDGSLAPADLVDYVAERGVGVMSITDHDTTAAYDALNANGSITIVPGVELSTTWMGRGIHIVGLNVDRNNTTLANGLAAQAKARRSRAKLISNRLEKLGLDCPLDAVEAIAGSSAVGRPHFAQRLVDTGAVKNPQAAFRKYLGAGKPGDVRNCWAPLELAVRWISESGGTAVLAHPAKYGMTNQKLRLLLEDFVAAGGRGIEVVCGPQDAATTRRLGMLAREFDLAASTGSDFHTPAQPWALPGSFDPLPRDLTPVWTLW
ncbi:MAG: PHP domain-containing protein [Woeseiaceae bacterium]|nr:PHP domain-containing protein [Woeseiaceae bacterium]